MRRNAVKRVAARLRAQLVGAVVAVVAALVACGAMAATAPGHLTALLEQQLRASGSATGIVAGTIGRAGEQAIFAVGTRAGGGPPMDGATRFEIGSITKALTGELLATLAFQRRVELDDRVEKWVMELAGRPAGALSLRQLASHTSGLPRVPKHFGFWWRSLRSMDDPYAHYGVDQLLDYLQGWQPSDAAPGYAYSNLGFALLGLALERAAGQSYAALLRETILVPGGAPGALLSPQVEAGAAMAEGHDRRGRPTAQWSPGAFAAAGAVRASASELLALLDRARQELPPFDHGAARPIASRETGTAVSSASRSVGIGWHRTARHDDRIVWHNGGTGGFRSFAGYSEVSRRAVVLLANGHVELDALGLHLLNPAFDPPIPANASAKRSGWASVWFAVPAIALLTLARWAWTGAPDPSARPGSARRGWRPPGSRLEILIEAAGGAVVLLVLARLLEPMVGQGATWWPWFAVAALLAAVSLYRMRAVPLWPADARGVRSLAWRLGWLSVGLLLLAFVA
jgi:CubicO group peptidase (beta-lactamase class C family)